MKDYIPESQFNPLDEPIGDRRWWYKKHYEQVTGVDWQGEGPDAFSPHTLSEENKIRWAILQGTLQPRNRFEEDVLSLIEYPRHRSEWPKKWVTCRKCKCDWTCTGYPAGKQTKFTDSINCHQLVEKSGYVWFWPNLCQTCADIREAKPMKPLKVQRAVKSPIVD
jgi:hypothetical protein